MKGIQYLVNSSGRKTAVIIPLAGHRDAIKEFLEDLYGRKKINERRKKKVEQADSLRDLAIIASRKDEPSRPFNDYLKERKRR